MPAAALALLLLAGCADATEPPAPRPSAVAVTPSHAEIPAIGQTMQLTAEVRDQNGRVMTGAVLTWSSSTAAVASVDASGLVTAASNGAATITATAGEASGTAAVTVEQEATAVTMSTDTATVVKGDTLRLMATAFDANGHEVLEAEFRWASLDTLVAAVDQEGLVVGVGPGEVSVTATSLGITGHATVVVKQTVDSIVVTPAADTIAPGDTLRLAAQVFDEDGNRVEGAQVFWSSSNTRLATVDSDGLVTGRGMGGTSTITAKAGEAQGTAQISVHSPDRAALVAFYHAVGGPSSVFFESGLLLGKWLSGPVSTWFGVTTDADGRVTRLDLGDPARERVRSQGLPVFNFFLNGTIPPEIGMLTKLEHLDLSEKDAGGRPNSLSGPLPPEIGNLTRLRVLDLHGLSNSFPPEFGNLANLEYLRAYLSSPFPPELEFANLRSLEHLSLIGYIGSIPQALGSLPNLEHLSLFGPFGGEIPPELGKASNLQYLNLQGFDEPHTDIQRLAGQIPSELGGLTRLRSLYLGGNFEGPIPSSLGNLGSLDSLTVSGANLSGPIPSELGKLTTLKQLSLSSVSGSIPPELGNLAQLRWLSLTGVSGPIPPTLGHLKALEELSLGGNLLSQSIPPELGDLRRLKSLSLESNYLSGAIPPELGKLTALESLSLSRNNLSGPIPPELAALTALTRLMLADNDLSGTIPPELGKLVALERLMLANNNLTPPIPPTMILLSNLTHLDLSGNSGLCYPGTQVFAQMPYGGVPYCNRVDQATLRTLYEATGGRDWTNQHNWNASQVLGEWQGVTADSLGRVLALELSGNGLVGQLPEALAQMSHLAKLDLSHNRLSGPLPQDLGMLSGLEELRVGDNPRMAGRLPMSLTRLGLKVLDYSGTGLCVPSDAGFQDWLGGIALHRSTAECVSLTDREILATLYEMTAGRYWLHNDNWLTDAPLAEWYGVSADANGRVDALYLQDNNLVGRLPPELGDLEHLRVLSLASVPIGEGVGNSLGGPIPSELGKLSRLWHLDLEWNRGLRGAIPPLDSLTNLRVLHLGHTRLSGPIPPELGNLTNLWSLKLSNWRRTGNDGLEGTIPPELGNLTRLIFLDLHHNSLEGTIPPQLGKLAALEELDLRGNKLMNGPLPSELTALGRLRTLLAGSTKLCAPDDEYESFRTWLGGMRHRQLPFCTGRAYLQQAVQAPGQPVPLVAGEPAILCCLGTRIPPLRARFYVDGRETLVERFRGAGSHRPMIPGQVVEPGLEMVIEIDSGFGFPARIPEQGRLGVEVVEMPTFELTLIPFLFSENPDSSIVALVEAMASDPHGHRMLSVTRHLLPISGLDVTAHEPVQSTSRDPSRLLSQTSVVRVLEGGTGYYMGMMAGSSGDIQGVARLGGQESFSIPDPVVMAHELGHNLGLQHAPCGALFGVDPYFPHSNGDIGNGWLFDLMSYCFPRGISAYHFTKALRHRQRNAAAADREVIGSPAKSLLLWGGTEGDGNPYLEPAFVVDAPIALPRVGGEYRLSGWAADGTEVFSLAFDMAVVADAPEMVGMFAFTIPVTWTGELAAIELLTPTGLSATLDHTTNDPMTILRDRVSGEVLAFLRQPMAAAAAAASGPGTREYMVLFSRGVPVF